jgi:hypothetical protein
VTAAPWRGHCPCRLQFKTNEEIKNEFPMFDELQEIRLAICLFLARIARSCDPSAFEFIALPLTLTFICFFRNKPEWKNRAGWLPESPQSKLEMYNPLVMTKIFWMKDVAKLNPLNTTYFLWVDAGRWFFFALQSIFFSASRY